jgi:hypothetical protein
MPIHILKKTVYYGKSSRFEEAKQGELVPLYTINVVVDEDRNPISATATKALV